MTRFSYSLDIALRMLLLLASRQRQLVALSTMVEELGVPYHNGVRVLRLLAGGGIVKTQRGRGGGVALARPPAHINLRQVVDLIDGPVGLLYCKRSSSKCPITASCTLKAQLSLLEERINQLYEEVNLFQLMEGREHAPATAQHA